MSATTPVEVRSFLAWIEAERAGTAGPDPTGWLSWKQGRLNVRWLPRRSAEAGAAPPGFPDLVLGDASEWSETHPDASLAAGVPIRFDAQRSELVALTSIVGLPPLFVYREGATVAIASDLRLLLEVPGVRLDFDARSVIDLGLIGHPVEHRTLFRDTELVPSASRVRLGEREGFRVETAWRLPEVEPLGWDAFIEAQIAAFTEGVRRTRLDGAFLSLTAGLDTRTVFTTLASQDRLLPTATMTGPRRSLDARIAGRLSAAYGVPHHAVEFDRGFIDGLPGYIETASLLSGGLASLDQAPEVFFYHRLGGGFSARLSGNLGNQVGRGGTEGVSVRGADAAILSADLRDAGAARMAPGRHWLLERLEQSERERLEFILKSEIPFTLVSNFPIGHHFAVQQTPYANRGLIETLAQRPPGGSVPSGSRFRMRLRDLAHRFMGEPERTSFQRTLVHRIGGFAAHCPINWGWRAKGGVSPVGALMGTATLFGMYARARGLDGGLLKGPLAWTGLPALHDFREARAWLSDSLREFTRDTLASETARNSGLFDRAALDAVLDDHFDGGHDHYHTVVYALDLALANRFFRSSAQGATAAPVAPVPITAPLSTG